MIMRFMTAVSLLFLAPHASALTLSPRVGHQNLHVDGGTLSGKGWLRPDFSNTPDGSIAIPSQPIASAFTNAPMLGLQLAVPVNELIAYTADLTFAKHHYVPDLARNHWALTLGAQLQLGTFADFDSYALAGLGYHLLTPHRAENKESAGGTEFVVKLKDLATLNADLGIGARYKLSEVIHLGFEYRFSHSVQAISHEAFSTQDKIDGEVISRTTYKIGGLLVETHEISLSLLQSF